MSEEIAFEVGPYAATEEIWQKALLSLAIDNKEGNKTIKRIGANHVQIVESEQIKNPFGSTDLLPSHLIAEFISNNKENTVWIRKR